MPVWEDGEKYRVRFRRAGFGGTLPGPEKEMVATFLEVIDHEFVFSGRPTFGTVRLSTRLGHYEIVSFEKVAKDTKCKYDELPLQTRRRK